MEVRKYVELSVLNDFLMKMMEFIDVDVLGIKRLMLISIICWFYERGYNRRVNGGYVFVFLMFLLIFV